MKFDLHMHTSRHSPDSQMDPLALVHRAVEIGLDGIVITEHDWLWTEAELEELRAGAGELVVLAGIEVTAREGHFLAYGVRDPFALFRGIGVTALCQEVHQQGGAVVGAHPFRWGQPFDKILQTQQPELDGLELMTSNMDDDCRRRAAAVFKASDASRPLAGLGSSDAHREEVLGFCYTEFEADIRCMEDLVNAIRGGRLEAHQRNSQS